MPDGLPAGKPDRNSMGTGPESATVATAMAARHPSVGHDARYLR